ncbi:MAG TPA: formylmethanofuran dehydrogenase subunit C [Burkholderiales bacterium]|nr:formylmethanofuran dehydrogenase subunit C [Burkholderiales bacterium]
MTLVLTLKSEPPGRVDMSPLVPERLAGLGAREIGALPLECGGRRVAAGELFAVSANDSAQLVIEGGSERLDRIGQGMLRGAIEVRGDAGAYLGRGMRGGSITVEGKVAAYCGSGMRDGLIQIRGGAGDFLAAALPGEHRGMQGGTILVHGNAGERLGDRMRRGMVLVEGGCGDFCASRMGAGTIAVFGPTGTNVGFAMRRGTVILSHPADLPPTFDDFGTHDLGFLRLLYGAWRSLPASRFAAISDDSVRVRRFVGDLANGGKGEVLVRV